MFNSIKWRLTAVFFSITAIFLFLLGLYLMISMGQDAYKNTQSRLLSNARLISDDLKEAFTEKPDKTFFQDYARKAKDDINARVTIIDVNGKVLGDSILDKDSMVNHSDRPEIKQAMSGEIGKAVRYSTSLQERMFYFAAPVKTENKVVGIVRVAIPWNEIQEGQNRIRLVIGTAVFVALILMVMVAFSFTSTIVVPLQEMTRAAQKMAEGKLDMIVNVNSNDEIGALSRGMNYMAERLRDTIRQITEERNKVTAILTSMNDGVIAIGRNGNILLINPAAEQMFNIKSESSIGKSIIEVIRNLELETLLHKALVSDKSMSREVQILVPEPKTFRISTAPLTNETGIVGVVAVIRDITVFQELDKIKTEFVANVSHELRTPLTSIKGFVETLLDGALEEPETGRHFLEIINEETDRLNRLLNDLLSLSGVEAKEPKIQKVPLDLEKIIYHKVSILSPQASEKNLALKVEIERPLPMIEADEDLIGQLMINLIDNAIKYTPEGGRIEIKAASQDEKIRVTVSDTGIGIPAESIPRLFERFYRVDKARSREMGGTGLGLAIVKHILEIHGGKIEVKSRVGQGSTFTFHLPVKTDKVVE